MWNKEIINSQIVFENTVVCWICCLLWAGIIFLSVEWWWCLPLIQPNDWSNYLGCGRPGIPSFFFYEGLSPYCLPPTYLTITLKDILAQGTDTFLLMQFCFAYRDWNPHFISQVNVLTTSCFVLWKIGYDITKENRSNRTDWRRLTLVYL